MKGHGTENDFVIVPADVELTDERVRALCDRRAGIGGDGVIRAVPGEDGRWFMDYRNADGSVSEMCGNGIRVYARYLRDHEGATFPLEIDTRDGLKTLTVDEEDGDLFTVDMGHPRVLGETKVSVAGHTWPAAHVDMGNPHAVAFVDDLADAGPLLEAPTHDPSVYPHGVNVEFVVRRGDQHVAMRVHERGVGETRSCGTGAAAAALATRWWAGESELNTQWTVDVPGGRLRVRALPGQEVELAGPAALVADGTATLLSR